MHLDDILVQIFVRNLIGFIIFGQVGPKLFKASLLEKNSHWKESTWRYTESVYHQVNPNVLLLVKQLRIRLYRFILYQNLDKQ